MTDSIQVYSLLDFIGLIKAYSEDDGNKFYFRGETSIHDYTIPSIYRKREYIDNEDKLFKDFLMSDPELFAPVGGANTNFDRLALMQHHGLPTRLLDFTRNPLVALYFATEQNNNDDDNNGQVFIFSNKINQNRSISNDNQSLELKVIKKLLASKQRNKDTPLLALDIDKSAFSDQIEVESSMVALSDNDKKQIIILLHDLYQKHSYSLINLFEVKDIQTISLKCFYHNKSVKRLYHEVGRSTPNFIKAIDPLAFLMPKFVQPRIIDERIKNQQGLFLFIPFVDTSNDNYPQNLQDRLNLLRVANNNGSPLTLTIPHSAKESIRKDLERFGITKDFIYPDHSNIAEKIKDSF